MRIGQYWQKPLWYFHFLVLYTHQLKILLDFFNLPMEFWELNSYHLLREIQARLEFKILNWLLTWNILDRVSPSFIVKSWFEVWVEPSQSTYLSPTLNIHPIENDDLRSDRKVNSNKKFYKDIIGLLTSSPPKFVRPVHVHLKTDNVDYLKKGSWIFFLHIFAIPSSST